MPIRSVTVLALCTAVAAPLAAQPQHFTLDHLRKVVGVGGVEIAPDGRTVVVTVTRPSYERDKNESELYAVDVATGAARQLTFERRSVGGARFSPDGRTLAFLAPDSAKEMQIWLLPMAGGETRRLTSHPTGVEHFAWRPDGGAIAFAASDERPKRDGEERFLTTFTVGDQDLFLRERVEPQHVWLVETTSGQERRITSGAWSLEFVLPPGSPPSGLSWSPDGRTIALAQVPAAQSGKLDSVHAALLDVASGAVRPLTSARRFENNPVFSPDGSSVAYWYPRDGRYDLGYGNEVYVAPTSGGEGRSVTRALDRNLFGAQWLADGASLLVAGNDRTSVGAWIVPTGGGAPRRLDTGGLVINGAFGYDIAAASHAPTIAFTATASDRPSELYVMDGPNGKPRRLTSFNAWADDVAWGKLERVTWKSGAFEADGVVGYPPDFDPSKKYPLVLYIHGGPTASSKLSFSSTAQLMAAQGWIVFQPNYRGSDNLGTAFQAAIVNDAGAGPGRDVMAGVAMLRARPYVDATRTAVTGWSYGGFMTSWLIGNYPNEWKAAMAGAPVTSWEDMYNFGDGSVTIRYAFGGSPWTQNRMAAYRAQSPITYAARIRTPTLVMSNMEDFRVPPTQAFALYRAMKDNGVETQFVGFTGRTHASSDPVNARERLRLWVDWVRTHIDGPRVVP
ncbi:WD40-like beta Propeller containing protein (plasmid) [Gemmatirosa kalamazoonensis]|uniref:WD40-like beta Propeller containing protein n=1 Tax=Gemmatirosa kalamazoonensis TaxID=861299 RepID=W0RTN9_9BACT|nr:S9 family peptidase [Gemmatirosa kalamazoonensis]AHG93817.1 WD40-like beta Propeller containing protein [Gemmatirosa kalamazoonensis]